MYARNQRQNAPQERTTSSNLADSGWVAAHTRTSGKLPRSVDVADQEATPKACGVGVAKPQGHSWTPPPSNGLEVNVGTILVIPEPGCFAQTNGKVRCRPKSPGWGGGPVVVQGRESRPHGEGVQRIRSNPAERGGRW